MEWGTWCSTVYLWVRYSLDFFLHTKGFSFNHLPWHTLGWGFASGATWSPFRTALFCCTKSVRCSWFSMHPIPSFAISNQRLGHIAMSKGTGKFLPTKGMKRFPVSHNIIHQVGYVTSFDNFSIVHKFTTLIPAHVGLMFDPVQNSLCFALPFIRDEAKDFLLCVVLWDISRWRGSCAFQMIVVFQVALQYLVVVSHFVLITEILPVQHSLHVLI